MTSGHPGATAALAPHGRLEPLVATRMHRGQVAGFLDAEPRVPIDVVQVAVPRVEQDAALVALEVLPHQRVVLLPIVLPTATPQPVPLRVRPVRHDLEGMENAILASVEQLGLQCRLEHGVTLTPVATVGLDSDTKRHELTPFDTVRHCRRPIYDTDTFYA